MRPRRVDSHQHFWRYDPAEYVIDARMGAIDIPARRSQTRDGSSGIHGIPSWSRSSRRSTKPGGSCRWPTSMHSSSASSAGSICNRPRSRPIWRRSRNIPKLVGVRHIVQSEPEGFLADDAFLRGIAELDRFGLTYDILVYERHLPEVIEFVSRFPHQRFVLDHLGKPDLRRGSLRDWRWQLRALWRFPRHVQAVRTRYRSRLGVMVARPAPAGTSETAVECLARTA